MILLSTDECHLLLVSLLASSYRVGSRCSVESDFTFTLVAQWDEGRTDVVSSSVD